MISATLLLNVCKLMKLCVTKPVNADRWKCRAASFPSCIPQEQAGLLAERGFAVEIVLQMKVFLGSCIADWAE